MGVHTADAIVLRRYPFRETSVIVTCLTDRYGKLKGLVKGLRAQPSRHRSAMEPLTISRLVFYDTRASQLHLISQCELLDPLTGLQQDLETSRAAAVCAELTDAVVPLNDPQPRTYQLLREVLERLGVAGSDRGSLRAYFAVRLLHLSGFRPQVDACVACGAAVHARGSWSVAQGGLLCAACLHQDPDAPTASPEALETLARLSDAEHPVPLGPALASHVWRWLEAFLRWHLDQPLKTLAA
jgi:DNA repair protein RecO (recombination protein O)